MQGTVLSSLHDQQQPYVVLIFINEEAEIQRNKFPWSRARLGASGLKKRHLPPEPVFLTSILTLRNVDLMKAKDES